MALGLLGPSAGTDEGRPASARSELASLQREIEALRRESLQLDAEVSQDPPPAERREPDARLRELEARIARLEEEVGRLLQELKQLGNAVDTLSEEERRRISLTVYGHLAASAYRGEPSLLDAELFELVLSGHPHKRLSFLAQVEFEQAAGVGGERGGEVVVEQALANFILSPALNLRAGALLVPFGNVNIDHFPSKREVVTRPLVSQVVVPGDWTDNAIGFYGRWLLGKTWLLSYEAYALAGLGSQVSALGLQAARQGYGIDNNGNKALVGHLALSRASRLELGLSGYTGRYDDAGRRGLVGWSATAVATQGPLRFTGEYDSFSADRAPLRDARLSGYYVRLAYDFGRPLLARSPLGKDFDEPRLSLVVQYDRASIDGPFAGAFESNRERRLTGCVAFRPSAQWVLKLAYEDNAASHRPLSRGGRDGWLGSVAFVF